MNGTLLHVTRQDVACFVLCVLMKDFLLDNNIHKADTFHRQLFTRRSSAGTARHHNIR